MLYYVIILSQMSKKGKSVDPVDQHLPRARVKRKINCKWAQRTFGDDGNALNEAG